MDDADYPLVATDLFSQHVDLIIDKAKRGDTESARNILKMFCAEIDNNRDKNGNPFMVPCGIGNLIVERKTQIDERILRYFGECFNQILSGEKVNKAMNLENDSHRPLDPNKRDKDINIAISADRMIRSAPNDKKTYVYSVLAIKNNVSSSKVKAAYLEHKDLAESVNGALDELEEHDKKWQVIRVLRRFSLRFFLRYLRIKGWINK